MQRALLTTEKQLILKAIMFLVGNEQEVFFVNDCTMTLGALEYPVL